MDNNLENSINKDLILRENLAIERTEMANDRTLLAFLRTSLYLFIAGITINSVLQLKQGLAIEITFIALSVICMVVGVFKYRSQKKRIDQSKRRVGRPDFT